jgi:predicted nucleotidyltransferase component of viral defense system
MAKRKLTSTEEFDLRQALHVAVLEALMVSRRWQPGELIFQGGTGLHLAHGSPRYSEDLDFFVDESLNLQTLDRAMWSRLSTLSWLPHDMTLTVSKAKEAHNPHSFVVRLAGEEVIGGVRVKVELWRTATDAMSSIGVSVVPVKLVQGPAAGMQTFVPAATVAGIYVDKVFALGARPYLKSRDVFDLYWIERQADAPWVCSTDDLRVRLATYPNETPAGWLEKAEERRAELAASGAAGTITADLKRWLPSSYPLDEDTVAQMLATTVRALDRGVDLMQEIRCGDGCRP